jgi:hypothetical protein
MRRDLEEESMMNDHVRESRRLMGVLLAITWAVSACGGMRPGFEEPQHVAVEEAPLGGEALAQRRQDMQRAFGDMLAFQATMSSLIDRRDNTGLASFDEFVAKYMGRHLDPLLAAGWQSSHPEVQAVDVNLRFVKADVLVQMRYPRRVQRVIDDIQKRYVGRDGMLVDYPVGEQSTLGEALAILKTRKWDG